MVHRELNIDDELRPSTAALHKALEDVGAIAISGIVGKSEEELVMAMLDDVENGYAEAIAVKVAGRDLVPGLAIDPAGNVFMDYHGQDGRPYIEVWRTRVARVEKVLHAVTVTPGLFSSWKESSTQTKPRVRTAEMDPSKRKQEQRVAHRGDGGTVIYGAFGRVGKPPDAIMPH